VIYLPEVIYTPETIWNAKQNHPELVVQDCVREFGLTLKQEERLREILRDRGVNKWLLARRRIIKLKQETKRLLKALMEIGCRRERRNMLRIHSRLQEICKAPRWVEWPKHVSHSRSRDAELCVEKGKRC